MTYFAERRKYQRCTSAVCKTLMSTDKKRWTEIELIDVSAGGLKFTSKNTYEVDTPLNFNICVYNMLSEFNMSLEGRITRMESEKGVLSYSVKFDNINKYQQIQLDEIIKSKITIKESIKPVSDDDGIYTFFFLPRIRSKRIKSYR
ncbi:MAG: PilZ domain-containing protein [Clostridia bacterium]|nr:PilZ domain-containing protein [Clostridia bacterium]